MAYQFMIGLPGSMSTGFCMMDPETLKKQRWTFVKYWLKKLDNDRRAIHNALSK